jgi:large subunit ribosomal protein L1
MAKKSKKMQDALKKVDSSKVYPVAEAVALAKETNIAKFDATVEVAYRLNVDPKKQTNKSVVLLYYQTELVKHKLF